MPASQFTPIPPNSYLWNTAHTVYANMPVVATSTAFQVDIPAGTAADVIIGVAQEDAGPSALNDAANKDTVTVQEIGVVPMYAGAAIAAGVAVKIGSTISVTPPGYASTVTVYPVITATQTAAGSQPYPIVGFAVSAASASGDIVYVLLKPGATY